MSEKGGEKKIDFTAIDGKMILTAIIGVLLCAVFVLTLIFSGVLISERYHGELNRSYSIDDSSVIDVISVDYETKGFTYSPELAYGETDSRALFDALDEDGDYYVINSSTKYNNVIDAITKLGGSADEVNFSLTDDFFYSGSILVVAAERSGLSYFGVDTITRDENYNIYIETSAVAADDSTSLVGKAVFIKIPNIQPAHVEVKERKEA